MKKKVRSSGKIVVFRGCRQQLTELHAIARSKPS